MVDCPFPKWSRFQSWCGISFMQLLDTCVPKKVQLMRSEIKFSGLGMLTKNQIMWRNR